MVYESIGASPVDWAGKPYPEIVEIAERDGSLLVVPVGSIEQHGPHLPTATDTLLVDAVAHTGAESASAGGVPVLVSPPVWTGNSAHHLPFGGTLSVDTDTLRAALRGVAETTLDNGFDAVLFLNGHGGNVATVGAAVHEIGHDHPTAEIMGLTYFELARAFIDDIRDSRPGGMGHAGEFETSLMLHLRPDLVHSDQIDGTHYTTPYEHEAGDMFASGPLTVHRPFAAYTDRGAAGDPSLATAEKGAELLDRLGDALRDLLGAVHESNQ